MKSFIKQSVIAVTLLLSNTFAFADVVGVENPGNLLPDVIVGSTVYSYDASTKLFIVESAPTFSATYNNGTEAKFIENAQYQFATYVDSNGDFTTGAAGTVASKVGFADITINTVRMVGDTDQGTGLTILDGEVLDFGWDGNDVVDALFSVVTAEDPDLFITAFAGFVLENINTDSNEIDFSRSFGYTFDTNYEIDNPSDTFSVPVVAVSEPAAIILLFGGCLVMFGFRARSL